MAKVGEDEVEYDESDPEEEKGLLGRTIRKREPGSDDEEGEEGEGEGEGERNSRMDQRAPIYSDESDGQGGVADYDDEDDDEEEVLDGEEDEEEEVYEDEEELEEEVYEDEEVEVKERNGERVGGSGGGVEVREEESRGRRVEVGEEVKEPEGEEGEEGKKESEPFAVPTAGAFYMHDDRFRANGRGRNRRTFGGRKLWESKDDKKWGHDKFEELTLQERHYEQGRRSSKGNFRARGGKTRGLERGYARRSRKHEPGTKSFSNGNNQNRAPNSVRGRGPRKYEPTFKNRSQAPPMQNKQPGKLIEKSSHGSSGRVPIPELIVDSDQGPPARKHSGLSSASPPFYPSGSSNKDIPLTQKRDVHGANTNRNLRTPVTDENLHMQQSTAFVRGKNIANSVGIDKLYIDDSITPTAGKPLSNLQMPPSVSSVVSAIQPSQSRAQGRGVGISGQMTYQATQQHSQVNRGPPTTQLHSVQRTTAQNCIQPPAQQLLQRSGSGSQASSPPKAALSINSYEAGEAETSSESSKSRTALVGKGKGSVQGSGRGSFLYGGAQVVGTTGNIGVSQGDQNFPTFLPVMQFGGQHPGGIGVPAVGMAFPGYVAQPQLGLGNSEMTWLPVLTGAAGALGARYCPPYFAVDGAYHARPSGQTASLGSSSKENSTNIPNKEWKPTQRPELTSDEFGQRQKPRRYSEMDFKQPSTST